MNQDIDLDALLDGALDEFKILDQGAHMPTDPNRPQETTAENPINPDQLADMIKKLAEDTQRQVILF